MKLSKLTGQFQEDQSTPIHHTTVTRFKINHVATDPVTRANCAAGKFTELSTFSKTNSAIGGIKFTNALPNHYTPWKKKQKEKNKLDLKILFYNNCRGLTNEERMYEFESAIKKINWDIVGLSEIR